MKLSKQYEIIKMLNGLLIKGYTLSESLLMMSMMNQKTIVRMKTLLEKGETLSHVFRQLKFHKVVYETYQIGENSNRLNETSLLVEQFLLFYIQTNQLINKVLMYPIMLYTVAFICIEFIKTQLYPVIAQLLNDFNQSQNPALLFISFNLLKIVGFVSLAIFILGYLFKPLTNVVSVVKNYRSLYVSFNLKILLTCGNSLDESLVILENTLNKKIYDVKTLRECMFEEPFKLPILSAFHSLFINFFYLGIKSNNLLIVLDDFTSIDLAQLNSKLTKWIYSIQLILFIFISTNILLIYYVVMVPMFTITESI